MQKRPRKRKLHLYVVFPLTCAFSLLLVVFLRPNGRPPPPKPPRSELCYGKYVYMHDLPTRFNTDILEGCRTLSKWTDMCTYMSNAGLGPELDDRNMLPGRGWYATDQFALERIFHERMKGYKCLTNDSGLATAVFVPFYAGLEVARHLWGHNVSLRDEAALDFVKWLRSRPEWSRMGGRDHFMVAGRITWDFRRLTDEDTNWGSKLLLLPETKNMSTLVLEASPWNENDIGIPYPTYFHPSEDSQLFKWSERVRKVQRKWLFSFAGAPRPNQTQSIRGRVIHQCGSSNRCGLLECDFGSSKCHSPASVMRLFENSTFCLQPQGDSYTRRSTFDSMVAGCIPVFFHPGSAYVQYPWHLPQEHSRYSVLISEDDIREGRGKNIEQVLAAIEEDRVKAMREEVINMIPKLIYIDPRANTNVTFKDAFDVAVEGVIARVERLKREVREGRKFKEENSWKVDLVGNEEPHEWDRFFYTSNR